MTKMQAGHTNKSESEARFEFGANWMQFLSVLDERRIEEAEESLRSFLSVESLAGKKLLDIGSGSGLFSLAARRMGATVVSFDYDPQSVACTSELKRRFFDCDDSWHIEQGSALDREYVDSLGKFDIVYSWGVLHHTGAMWVGFENAVQCVNDQGMLFIAIYNDQGWKSRAWWFVKALYNKIPHWSRWLYIKLISFVTGLLLLVKYTLLLKPMVAIRSIFRRDRERGMTAKYDSVDWIGGYPYEYATYETLVGYFEARGFELVAGKRSTGLGCHELVFRRL